MITTSYNAANLFVAKPAVPLAGNPTWMDLKIDSNRRLNRDVARGAGLYVIHFRDRLLYVGKFLGKRTNPFAGDVCHTRWAKHLGTLTLRDRRVSFNRSAIKDMRSRDPQDPPLADVVAAAARPVIINPRGRVSSLNRALFAAENWTTFSRLADAQGLAGFTITYTRIDPGIKRTMAELRTAVGSAERQVIARVRPRCNATIPTGTAGEMSTEDAGRILKDALAAALDVAANSVAELAQVKVTDADADADGPDDAVAMTSEEAFLEKLEDNVDALVAVDGIEAAFDTIADAYIGHTRTEGGDLRIRSIVGRRAFFNVAAIQWKSKSGEFAAEIALPIERCLELGASAARPNYAQQTLGTLATFRVPDATAGMVRCLVEAAAQQRNNPR